MQIDFGLCRNFTFEKLDSKYTLSALQHVVSMCKCCGTAGSTISSLSEQLYQSLFYFANLSHEMCYVGWYGKPRVTHEQKFSICLLMPNIHQLVS